jgi:hypothetical protein
MAVNLTNPRKLQMPFSTCQVFVSSLPPPSPTLFPGSQVPSPSINLRGNNPSPRDKTHIQVSMHVAIAHF